MLMELVEKGNGNLIVELSSKNPRETRWVDGLQINLATFFVDMLNMNLNWAEISDALEESSMSDVLYVAEIISKLEVEDIIKDILPIFVFKSKSRISRHYIARTEKFLRDAKRLISNTELTTDDKINFMEFKYSPREKLYENDFSPLPLYNPILYKYGVDDDLLHAKLCSRRDKDDYEEVEKWLETQIHNQLHMKIIKKLLLNVHKISFEERQLISVLDFDELLEYLKLKEAYEQYCTKFKVVFLDELLVISFIQLLKNDIIIRQCKLCGKFFISQNGTLSCSDNCKNKRITYNKIKRNENVHYENYTNSLKKIKNKIEIYSKNSCCVDEVLEGLEAVQEYYRFICKKVRQALIDHTDNVYNEEGFWSNFDTWCEAIIPQKGEYNRIQSVDEITYYKLTISGFQKENIHTLWDNDEFYEKSKYKTLLHKIIK